MISSVTQSFCHSCPRVRVSTEGKLFTCLFATGGHDLRALMRGGCSDEQLSTAMGHIWRERIRVSIVISRRIRLSEFLLG